MRSADADRDDTETTTTTSDAVAHFGTVLKTPAEVPCHSASGPFSATTARTAGMTPLCGLAGSCEARAQRD